MHLISSCVIPCCAKRSNKFILNAMMVMEVPLVGILLRFSTYLDLKMSHLISTGTEQLSMNAMVTMDIPLVGILLKFMDLKMPRLGGLSKVLVEKLTSL